MLASVQLRMLIPTHSNNSRFHVYSEGFVVIVHVLIALASIFRSPKLRPSFGKKPSRFCRFTERNQRRINLHPIDKVIGSTVEKPRCDPVSSMSGTSPYP